MARCSLAAWVNASSSFGFGNADIILFFFFVFIGHKSSCRLAPHILLLSAGTAIGQSYPTMARTTR